MRLKTGRSRVPGVSCFFLWSCSAVENSGISGRFEKAENFSVLPLASKNSSAIFVPPESGTQPSRGEVQTVLKPDERRDKKNQVTALDGSKKNCKIRDPQLGNDCDAKN